MSKQIKPLRWGFELRGCIGKPCDLTPSLRVIQIAYIDF